jgi:hypothetical protein
VTAVRAPRRSKEGRAENQCQCAHNKNGDADSQQRGAGDAHCRKLEAYKQKSNPSAKATSQ